ncbi:hypothetical protein Pelo_3343 [Pelomyxa schiedti]|nr:hypothetical protein Pelo_3343 [Pelomyxa schiedti]
MKGPNCVAFPSSTVISSPRPIFGSQLLKSKATAHSRDVTAAEAAVASPFPRPGANPHETSTGCVNGPGPGARQPAAPLVVLDHGAPAAVGERHDAHAVSAEAGVAPQRRGADDAAGVGEAQRDGGAAVVRQGGAQQEAQQHADGGAAGDPPAADGGDNGGVEQPHGARGAAAAAGGGAARDQAPRRESYELRPPRDEDVKRHQMGEQSKCCLLSILFTQFVLHGRGTSGQSDQNDHLSFE